MKKKIKIIVVTLIFIVGLLNLISSKAMDKEVKREIKKENFATDFEISCADEKLIVNQEEISVNTLETNSDSIYVEDTEIK